MFAVLRNRRPPHTYLVVRSGVCRSPFLFPNDGTVEIVRHNTSHVQQQAVGM
jgi:hypothetical protein